MHLVPVVVISYIFSFLDRINVGFTKLQMQGQLGITDAVFGLAAGLFFVTYFFFEVPSNILLERIGARVTLLRIMVLWGLTSAATMFVHTPGQFYTERILLGLFEAGFFPGIILYLSYWIPSSARGNATGWFLMSPMLAGLIGGPVSGLIMTYMGGICGLKGWQWCFLVEGIPCVLLGIFNFFYLSDKPEKARWLSAREKAILLATLARDRVLLPAQKGRWAQVFGDPRVYLLAYLYFASVCGGYVLNFWLPTMVRGLGVKSIANIGFLVMIPFACGLLGIYVIANLSDHAKSRRWFFVFGLLVGSIALSLSPIFGKTLGTGLAILSIASFGINGTIGLYWSLPSTYLRKEAAAAGVALCSSLGVLGGFVGPYLVGYVRTKTGTDHNALYVVSGLMILAVLAMIVLVPERAVRVGAHATDESEMKADTVSA